MVARDLDVILAANWNTSNYTTPTFINEQNKSHHVYKKVCAVKRMSFESASMGIIDRSKYTPESHHAWQVWCVEETDDLAEDMAEEVKRICATFTPTTTEKQMLWEGGDYEEQTFFRSVFTFIVFIRVSGIAIG